MANLTTAKYSGASATTSESNKISKVQAKSIQIEPHQCCESNTCVQLISVLIVLTIMFGLTILFKKQVFRFIKTRFLNRRKNNKSGKTTPAKSAPGKSTPGKSTPSAVQNHEEGVYLQMNGASGDETQFYMDLTQNEAQLLPSTSKKMSIKIQKEKYAVPTKSANSQPKQEVGRSMPKVIQQANQQPPEESEDEDFYLNDDDFDNTYNN